MEPMPGCSQNNSDLIEPTDDRRKKISSSRKRPKKDFWETIKYGNRTEVAWAIIADFFSGSTIGGLRFFSHKVLHWTERAWWIVSFGMALFLSGLLIRNAWIIWDEKPVVIGFAEKMTPIWDIPFPTVTICPQTKTRVEKFDFLEAYHMIRTQQKENMSAETIKYMESVLHLCDVDSIKHVDLGKNISDDSIYQTILDVAPTINDTVYACKWYNKLRFELFNSILTEEGVCFTFNALNSREIYTDEMAPGMMNLIQNPNITHWNMENGYNNSDKNRLNTYPIRTISAGRKAGLFVLVRRNVTDLEYLCRGPVQGFKFLLHSPGEVPQISKHFYRLPLGEEVLITIEPQMITTSDDLRHYKPQQRQCYFESERKLRFFRIYTQRNCELECLANFTKSECGCVKFSMPRDINTPICGTSKIMCYNAAEYKLAKKNYFEGLQNIADVSSGCGCLPACTTITYNAQISQSKFDFYNLLKAFKQEPDEDYERMQMARLAVFFKQRQFIAMTQSEYYSQIGFLANCGGLLGVFLGVSFLSIIETIYYFTLRLSYTLSIRRTYIKERLCRWKKYTCNNEQNSGERVVPILKNIPKITIVAPAEERKKVK